MVLEKGYGQWSVVRGPLELVTLTGLVITGKEDKQRTTDH